jgi:hypothetical protein
MIVVTRVIYLPYTIIQERTRSFVLESNYTESINNNDIQVATVEIAVHSAASFLPLRSPLPISLPLKPFSASCTNQIEMKFQTVNS